MLLTPPKNTLVLLICLKYTLVLLIFKTKIKKSPTRFPHPIEPKFRLPHHNRWSLSQLTYFWRHWTTLREVSIFLSKIGVAKFSRKTPYLLWEKEPHFLVTPYYRKRKAACSGEERYRFGLMIEEINKI